ncbi:hypothetical protein DQ04_03951010 [Trypanosoma grayi]|uniref:hypothetical protein n=1 Tax=Trypanosoma grayi TaxID=71804 RepID=UPI0004F4815C|nr:hypothetical protein DQ04_03951010 [Trypanosoma grayi]KEG10269.1 hypothetical protein DQ04_03951010 [Trypanosoma grayi]
MCRSTTTCSTIKLAASPCETNSTDSASLQGAYSSGRTRILTSGGGGSIAHPAALDTPHCRGSRGNMSSSRTLPSWRCGTATQPPCLTNEKAEPRSNGCSGCDIIRCNSSDVALTGATSTPASQPLPIVSPRARLARLFSSTRTSPSDALRRVCTVPTSQLPAAPPVRIWHKIGASTGVSLASAARISLCLLCVRINASEKVGVGVE